MKINNERNFPNLVKEINMQVQEAQRIPIMMVAKSPTPRHFIIKKPKVKDRKTLKSSKRKEVSYQKVARWETGGREWVKRGGY